jgi:hypothetical protein
MKNIVILFGVALLLLNCTNNKPLPNGYDLVERDNKDGLMPVMKLKPTQFARYWKTPPTGGYTTLMLGESQNVHSSILLKCRNLAGIDTTKTLVSATLKMHGNYLFGDDSLMTISMHRVNEDWDETTVLIEDAKDAYDADPIETAEITFHKDDWAEAPFTDLDFMREWIVQAHQTEQTKFGLIIKTENTDKAAEFVSRNSTANPPHIQIVTANTDGENDTTNAVFSHDASLLEYMSDVEPEVLEESPETLRVGSATGYSSMVKFDVSEIPAQATIHRALLTFYVDGENSRTKEDASMSISAARIVSDSIWTPTTVELDSLSLPASDEASSSNETFAYDSVTPVISKIVQKWISDEIVDEDWANYGFILVPPLPGHDFQEMSLRTGATDSVFAPTLEITYSLPPSHRFAN